MKEKVGAQMDVLEKACIRMDVLEVDVPRVQLVVMFLKAMFAAADVMVYMCAGEQFKINEKFAAKLVEFSSAATSIKLLVWESQPKARIINTGWCFKFADWR